MKIKWYLIILFWLFAGIAFSLIYTLPVNNFHGFIYRMMNYLSVINSVAMLCSISFLILDRKIISRIENKWFYYLIIAIIFGFSFYISKMIVSPFVYLVCPEDIPHQVDKNHIYVIVFNFVIFLLITATNLLLYSYFKLKREWERKVFEIESLKRLQLETKLALLQSKVNPHFLFNTLNTTLDLVYKLPEKVEKIILNLSDMYRTILNLPESDSIPLNEEIKLITKYLEIEKIRLGERLKYEINTDAEFSSYRIPPLILQPLIENAVIHGIAPKKDGGIIKLNIFKKEKSVCISINDSGIGFNPDTFVKGFGTFSVKERIKLFYKSKGHFELTSSESNGTKIEINLPYE